MQSKFYWACFALLSVLIQGCPSSGSSTTPLGGVAAVGAPLAGATVILVDAAGTTKTATADPEGAYTFDDVGAMTAPFLLKATGVVGGVEQTMYSALDEKPTPGETAVLNATPMTNAVVVQASGGDPAILFANPKNLDANAMKEAKEKIILVLADQMKDQGLDPTKFDPFKTPFKANSSGLDKMLDLVKIQADTSGQMKLTNKATGAETAITKAEKPADMTAKKMPPSDPKLLTMDFSKVKNLVSGMNKLMGTSNPPADAFKEFVDVDFLSNGKTFATFTEMVSKESGTTLAGFVFGPCNPDTYVCDGTVALIQKGGAMKQEVMPVKYDNKNATWKFYGNQRKVGFDLNPTIIVDVNVKYDATNKTYTPTPVVTQGFELEIENQNDSYSFAELWMGIKAKDGTDFSYTLITTYEKSARCYQLVLPVSLRSSEDSCADFMPYETLATQAKKTNDEIKAAYAEGRLKFKMSVKPVSGDKFDVPPFRPTFIEITKNDENFKKMLESKFITSELGSTSITMPKGVDLEWVGFYLYNSAKQLNTVENIYLDSEGQNSFKSLGDTITSEEICKAAAKNIGPENLTCSKSDQITSIFWKFRDPMGSELKITYGYHLTAE